MNMNILYKILANYSEEDSIKVKIVKEPINLINKDISQSKVLLESFFKKLNGNINNNISNNNTSLKSTYVKLIF